MVVSDKRPLDSIHKTVGLNSLVEQRAESFFAHDGINSTLRLPGTISTMCETNCYLNLTHEYVQTPHPILKCIRGKRTRRS